VSFEEAADDDRGVESRTRPDEVASSDPEYFRRTADRRPGQRWCAEGASTPRARANSTASLRELAADLFVTPNTLKTHLRAIYASSGPNPGRKR